MERSFPDAAAPASSPGRGVFAVVLGVLLFVGVFTVALRAELKAAHGRSAQDQTTIAELRAAKSAGGSTTVAANAELRAVRSC